MFRIILFIATLFGFSTHTVAEVIRASGDHFELYQVGESKRTVEEMWDRLVEPKLWWDPDHSYSKDASNLSLDLKAGGRWLERWDDGEIIHGTVVLFKKNQELTLNAPFGPLLGLAVTDIWTITLTAIEQGTRVEFREVANGTAASQLEQMAAAVDYVKSEAMRRLVAD